MDDRLRLYNNLNIVYLYIEQPFCLNDFQSLIDHGRRIDRNLPSHRPVRMLQSIFHLDV